MGNIADITAVVLQSALTGEVFTHSKLITQGKDNNGFRLSHESLAPGHRASSPHTHSKSDEVFLVLRGNPTLYIKDEAKIMAPGDYLVLKAGGDEHHHLENNSKEWVELIQIYACAEDDVIDYKK